MARFRWIWKELTRQRGPTSHRFYRVGRSSRSGIALLLTITIILLLTILVTEITHSAVVRAQLAANTRDEMKAEALAFSGMQMHRMVLVASKQMGNNPMVQQYGQAFGFNGDTLWQMLPVISSQFMRIIFVTDGDREEGLELKEQMHNNEVDLREESTEELTNLHRNFLDFDGDFRSEIVDENRRLFVGNLKAEDFSTLTDPENQTASHVYGLMSGEEHDKFFFDRNLDRWEIIGNLADWVDKDTDRVQGGAEESPYQILDDPYMPKNAPFDTLDEIRLVDGWHLDEVWERYGRHLTIYGGKVNVNTADKEVLHALLMAYIDPIPYETTEMVQLIQEFRITPPELGGGIFKDADGFVTFLQSIAPGTVKPEMKSAVTTDSNVFRVTSVGGVGDASVKIECVYDFSDEPTGKVLYWGIE